MDTNKIVPQTGTSGCGLEQQINVPKTAALVELDITGQVDLKSAVIRQNGQMAVMARTKVTVHSGHYQWVNQRLDC